MTRSGFWRDVGLLLTFRHPALRGRIATRDPSVLPFRATGRHDARGRLRVSWLGPRLLVAFVVMLMIVLFWVAIVAAFFVLFTLVLPQPTGGLLQADAPPAPEATRRLAVIDDWSPSLFDGTTLVEGDAAAEPTGDASEPASLPDERSTGPAPADEEDDDGVHTGVAGGVDVPGVGRAHTGTAVDLDDEHLYVEHDTEAVVDGVGQARATASTELDDHGLRFSAGITAGLPLVALLAGVDLDLTSDAP